MTPNLKPGVTPLTTPTLPPPRIAGITLSYKDIQNAEMHSALRKLDQFTGWTDTKDIHRFNKLKNTVEGEEKKAGEWYRKLVNKYAQMELMKRKNKETGEMEPVLNPKTNKPLMKPKWAPGPGGEMQMLFHDPKAFEKDARIFGTHTFTIKCFRFQTEDFVKAELTPAEIRACVKMLTDIPEDLELEDVDDVDTQTVPDDLAAIIPPDEPEEVPEAVASEETPADGRDAVQEPNQ